MNSLDEPIRVSIGSESLQRIPCEVLKHSILRRTTRRVEFTESWNATTGWHPLIDASPRLKNGTAFSAWRWIVPTLYGQGKAIYLDSDQVVLADIGELWDSLPDGKTIAAVCNAVGVFGKKTPEPDKVQTSVMVMDCEKLRQRARMVLQECHHGKLKYSHLMQATWLPRDEVEELPAAWNYFGIHTPLTKLLHYSHVGSQPFRNPDHPFAFVWWEELRDAVEREVITIRDVQQEAERGHLSPLWAKRLRKYAA